MSTNYLALLIASGALAAFMLYRLVFWIIEGRRALRPGHQTPRPSIFSRMLRLMLGRFFAFMFVGPIKVVGASNLEFMGRFIALGNHQTERDALVSLWMMGARPVRYFIADNQARGLRAPIVAFTGGIVVHSEPHAAAAALHTAVHALEREQDSSFVIFPQGYLRRDNQLRRQDFKHGTAVLGRLTAERSRRRVAYLPFGIHYDRNPDHATPFHRFIRDRLRMRFFRRFFGDGTVRAVICVGAPIPVEVLPEDAALATDSLFEQVFVLTAQAERICAEWKP